MATPLIHWIASFLWPYRIRVVGILLLSVTEIALLAAAPWTLKLIVDQVLGSVEFPATLTAVLPILDNLQPITLLLIFAVSGLLLQMGSEAARMVHTQWQVDMGQHIVHDLRSKLLNHLQALPLKHHVTHRTSDSVYRLDADTYCVNDLVTGGVFPLVLAGLNLAVMFTILLQIDSLLAIMALSITPFIYLCLRYHTTTLTNQAEAVKTKESWLIERAYETLRSISAIKSFTRETHERDRFNEASTETISARLNLTWQESLFSGAITAITLLGTTLVLIVGGLHVLSGELALGTLLVVIAYMAAVYDPVSSIAHTIGSLQQALVSTKRVQDIFSVKPEVPEEPGALTTAIQGHLQFKNVSFSYDDTRQVLDAISFTAGKGNLVAIVGPTGAGKTTLANLIPRLFDATSGQVLIDGVDITRYGLHALRKQIALVPQNPILFAGTIRDNIKFGDLEASDNEVEQAAQLAHIHSFIQELPNGYETVIGEDGSTLSGGERQRLGVARAMLKDAPILILDEPTSAIDSISESTVFEAIRHLRPKRTTLVIAHRLTTIKDATCIIVLNQGRIAAVGQHDRLLANCELYRQLWLKLSRVEMIDSDTMAEPNLAGTTSKTPS